MAILPFPAPRSPAQACQGQAAVPPVAPAKARGHPGQGWRRCQATLSLGAPLMPIPSRLAGGPGTGARSPGASQPCCGGVGLQGRQGLCWTAESPWGGENGPSLRLWRAWAGPPTCDSSPAPGTATVTPQPRCFLPHCCLPTRPRRRPGVPAREGRFQGTLREMVTSEARLVSLQGDCGLETRHGAPPGSLTPSPPLGRGCGSLEHLAGRGLGSATVPAFWVERRPPPRLACWHCPGSLGRPLATCGRPFPGGFVWPWPSPTHTPLMEKPVLGGHDPGARQSGHF